MSGEIEFDKCDFCKEEKPVWRTYLNPTKYVKPADTKFTKSCITREIISL